MNVFGAKNMDDYDVYFKDADFNDSYDEEFTDNDFEDNEDYGLPHSIDNSPIYSDLANVSVVKPLVNIDDSSFINMNFRKDENGNYRVKSDNDIFCEAFYFEPIMITDGKKYEAFIKNTENCIRKSRMYSAYIDYLKNVIGLKHDAFNSEITDEVASIEMHHGPIFTLYDYVKIIMDYCFDKNIPVNTFTVARLVMYEHAANRVQVAMLSKNNHNLVHAGKLFLDFRQCHGSLKDFISRYGTYIKASPKLLKKIADYKNLIESGRLHDTSYIDSGPILSWASNFN